VRKISAYILFVCNSTVNKLNVGVGVRVRVNVNVANYSCRRPIGLRTASETEGGGVFKGSSDTPTMSVGDIDIHTSPKKKT